jgi:hypothetical protein
MTTLHNIHALFLKIACQAGQYGKNCGQRCSENCRMTNRCNRFTGECDGGCIPGWRLPTCQQGNRMTNQFFNFENMTLISNLF